LLIATIFVLLCETMRIFSLESRPPSGPISATFKAVEPLRGFVLCAFHFPAKESDRRGLAHCTAALAGRRLANGDVSLDPRTEIRL
jgi:hypothetical protein